MNKLDRYDTLKLIEARKIINAIRDYNNSCSSSPLYKKLNTIVKKIDSILDTELEPKLQEEYNLLGRV